jgi:hypothetical protein
MSATAQIRKLQSKFAPLSNLSFHLTLKSAKTGSLELDPLFPARTGVA